MLVIGRSLTWRNMAVTQRPYRIERGTAVERFHNSRAKIQMYGGGYGNGKTAALCIKALRLVKEYPGCNGLLARATYPKLNDTLRTEFFKWCPKKWIKSFSKSDNIVEFANGSRINFRYVAQQGKATEESTTSNLLSATYDFIGIDQIEDPEITYKDFLDLLGRLRGNAPYDGPDDKTMPATGPRWFMITCNPTRNWVYHKLVRPLHDYKRVGLVSEDLLIDPRTKQPLMDLMEASTYENASNLGADFIATLEATYKGQMRDRFLLGKWAGYEGLVYPAFDLDLHVIKHEKILEYYKVLIMNGYDPTINEGYDYGMAKPACYIYSFTDPNGNVFLLDGFYQAEKSPEWQAAQINKIRETYNTEYHVTVSDYAQEIWADPQIFRRTPGKGGKVVGETIADMFRDHGIHMKRGNNNISNGIVKVRAMLEPVRVHRNPITGNFDAPHLYISTKLPWWITECSDYYWARDKQNESEDVPRDGKDHAMDATKYLLSAVPSPADLHLRKPRLSPDLLRWSERDAAAAVGRAAHRYGA